MLGSIIRMVLLFCRRELFLPIRGSKYASWSFIGGLFVHWPENLIEFISPNHVSEGQWVPPSTMPGNLKESCHSFIILVIESPLLFEHDSALGYNSLHTFAILRKIFGESIGVFLGTSQWP